MKWKILVSKLRHSGYAAAAPIPGCCRNAMPNLDAAKDIRRDMSLLKGSLGPKTERGDRVQPVYIRAEATLAYAEDQEQISEKWCGTWRRNDSGRKIKPQYRHRLILVLWGHSGRLGRSYRCFTRFAPRSVTSRPVTYGPFA